MGSKTGRRDMYQYIPISLPSVYAWQGNKGISQTCFSTVSFTESFTLKAVFVATLAKLKRKPESTGKKNFTVNFHLKTRHIWHDSGIQTS